MKDAYSFDLDFEASKVSYNKMFVAYLRTFARMGLKAIPMEADTGRSAATSATSSSSRPIPARARSSATRTFWDFDVLGADTDYRDTEGLQKVVDYFTSLYARTDEKHDPEAFAAAVPEGRRYEGRGIEVGHIFHFGTKYSAPLAAEVAHPDGSQAPVFMGSYGIGVSRLVGGIIEASHDEAGIVWPEAVAPFKVGLVNLKVADAACSALCEETYGKLQSAGVEVLYDDRDESAGAKFATMDLIGLPWQLVIGPRGLKAGTVELKNRASGDREELSLDSALARLSA